MKTAEEIFKQKSVFYRRDDIVYQSIPEIIEAMEEYATQFKPKKLIVADVQGLLNQVALEEISFSRMVELLNEKTGAI